MQDNDRLQLQQAGCAAVFEPAGSLYHQGQCVSTVWIQRMQQPASSSSCLHKHAGPLRLAFSSVVLDPASNPSACPAAVEGASSDAGNVVGREVQHPDAHETWVTVQQLQRGMCGDSRPHFFRGVATVSLLCCQLAGHQLLCGLAVETYSLSVYATLASW